MIDVDEHRVVKAFLTVESTTLYGLIGTSVYWGVLDRDETGKAIVIHREGGQDQAGGLVSTPVFVIKCYAGAGGSYTEAREIYRAVHDRFLNGLDADNGGRTNYGVIVTAFEITSQDMPPDPDLGWPCYMGKWEILVTGTEA